MIDIPEAGEPEAAAPDPLAGLLVEAGYEPTYPELDPVALPVATADNDERIMASQRAAGVTHEVQR